MSLKTDIALLSLEELKEWLDLGATDDPSADNVLINWINAASETIKKYTGRKFIKPSTALQEIFNGDGQKDYYVRYLPIVSITAVYLWNGSSFEAHTGTRTYDGDSGRVYFTDGNLFIKGTDNWRIDYIYGYALADVPSDLKAACAEMIARKKKQFDDGIHGVSAWTFGDQTISYSFDDIPKDIQATLNRYKHPRTY